MKKKFSEIFTSKFILILVTGLCVIFIAISFFTNKLVTPLKNVVSAVVVPLQKGMNYMGLWGDYKYLEFLNSKNYTIFESYYYSCFCDFDIIYR